MNQLNICFKDQQEQQDSNSHLWDRTPIFCPIELYSFLGCLWRIPACHHYFKSCGGQGTYNLPRPRRVNYSRIFRIIPQISIAVPIPSRRDEHPRDSRVNQPLCYGTKQWESQDSNLLSLSAADLQSAPALQLWRTPIRDKNRI